MAKLPSSAKVHPFDNIDISVRIHAHRVGSGEQRGIALIIWFVGFAIRFPPISEMSYEFAVGVQDGHSAAQVWHIELTFVLIKATWVTDISGQGSLIIQLEGIDFEPIVVPVSNEHFRLALERINPNSVT